MINVALIEDNIAFAKDLQHYLNLEKDISCQHVFFDAISAIESLPKTNIDVAIVDIYLPDKTGIECISILKPLVKANFLICSNFENTEMIFSALQAGAFGYITKSEHPKNIIKAIREIHTGGSPMSAQIARKVIESFCNNFQKQPNQLLQKLTIREQEILNYLSDGLRYKEIADKAMISQETVRTHVRNIYQKLQVSSRVEALNKVYKN